jgi:hypothetical protein
MIFIYLQAEFHSQGVGMLMVYPHTKFHIPGPNSFLLATFMPKAKFSFSTIDMSCGLQ